MELLGCHSAAVMQCECGSDVWSLPPAVAVLRVLVLVCGVVVEVLVWCGVVWCGVV